MTMVRSVLSLALTAALAGVTACGAAQQKADPVRSRSSAATSSPAAPVSSSVAPPSTSPVPTASTPAGQDAGPRLNAAQIAAMTQARASVSDAAIMRQLADTAERIARQLASGSLPPTPTNIDPGSNEALGYALMIKFGWPPTEWPPLQALWRRESGWNQYADNASSHAYGIPQSLPASKMAVVGPDWRTNPATQIKWGLAYIGQRYGSPTAAWAHSQQTGWY